MTSPGKLHSLMEIRKMKDEETGLTIASRLEKVTIGFDVEGDPITSLVALESEPPAEMTKDAKMKPNEQTMFSILHAAKRLSTSEWNERAREAGIGEKRKADLYDIRMKLKNKGLVTQLGEQWSVKHD